MKHDYKEPFIDPYTDKVKETEKRELPVDNIVIWHPTKNELPKFGELVLVWCRIYGMFLATYEEIDGSGFGNWQDMQGNLGILPPVYWMKIPEAPEII